MHKHYWLVMFDYRFSLIVIAVTIQVWQALIDSPAYESDREACFKWFARVSVHVCVCACVCVCVCVYVYVYIVCVSMCVYVSECVYV